LVSDNARYVVGTFELMLNSKDSSSQNDVVLNIDERSDFSLDSIGFSSEHKNYVHIKEKVGIAVELLCPAAPVRI